jgi:hypothetical protein
LNCKNLKSSASAVCLGFRVIELQESEILCLGPWSQFTADKNVIRFDIQDFFCVWEG